MSGVPDYLVDLASPALPVGVGFAGGDPRRERVLRAASFCPVLPYGDPESLLAALRRGEVAAAVRGSLPAGGFLRALKEERGLPEVRRVALLVLPGGRPFLLGPVGIDEGGTARRMRAMAGDMKRFCSLLGWEPRVGVLSAGRPEDAGRGSRIAASIRRGEAIAGIPGVRHFNIAIEEALSWANCVIAPDGVTGNLVYRTLVHLGSGSSLGALYFPLDLRLADTSRSGPDEEYLGAVALANIAAARAPANR